MKVVKKLVSLDASAKYLLKLVDGVHIEAVHIPQADGANLCISCQVGCMNKCRHCATGRIEYVRDLSSEEIVEQVETILEDEKFAEGKLKILFMGMGEPLLNYENVISAIKTFKLKRWSVDACNIIVSTSGIVPGIYKLETETVRPRLAVTIGATSDEKRGWLLIPTGKLYPISTLLVACREYAIATGDSVVFQYPLIKDFNDSLDEARALAGLVADIPCEVHIIPFNEFEGSSLRRPTPKNLSGFSQTLSLSSVKATMKPSFGIDINAGCGQLIAEG